ncbi:MAG: hypothetical protein QOF89_1289 [Acidobacteriota bacterium]|nr:hypothetical protein [Acidobacteriota bacterium]
MTAATKKQIAAKSRSGVKGPSRSDQFPNAQARPFTLSWSHYVFLLGIIDGENATIGIVLCKKKNEALVEITLPRDANIHAREYRLYLPSKEELRQKLQEWAVEAKGE